MTSTKAYIKEWQQALQNEINYLKKYGSNKYLITNGRLLSTEGSYTYYFDTSGNLRIPVGTAIKLEWGSMKQSGRVLSSEGKGVMLSLEKSFGDLVDEAYLIHDPWELLEQLIQRLDEIKKNKQKRLRIKNLMDPSMPAKHPQEKIKSNVHELLLRSKYNPVTFVWGPPGTGKTYTLARVAANKYFQEKRVLILSHSNQAVDVLIGEISSFVTKKNRFNEGDILRYGFLTGEQLANHDTVTTSQLLEKQDPELAADKELLVEERRKLKQDLARSFSKRDTHSLLELEIKIAKVLEKIRQKEIEFVKNAYIVGATLAKAASDPVIHDKDFDVVILDEASMAYVPQAGFAASLGKRVIICGDFKQLPSIAASRDALVTKWLKEDIFHRAGVVEWVKEGKLHPHLFLLKEQRRMHPDISSFTNQYIYHSLVGDHESVRKSRNAIVENQPFPGRASILVDSSFTGAHCISEKNSNSRLNLWQLLLSFQVIHESYLGGARSIGFVTPYRAQSNLMELLLEDVYEKERLNADIISATVHRFQGSERDVMVFDTVDGEPQERAGMLLTGADSERLINVAITRTKGKFIHISNQAFIKTHVYHSKTLRQLVEHQVRHNQAVRKNEIGTWIKNQHSKLQWMHARKLEKVFQDIDSARLSIMLSLPDGTELSEDWKLKLKNRDKRTSFIIFSEEDWTDLGPTQLIQARIPFPFIMIDKKIFWLGMMIEGIKAIKPPYIAARLESAKISEYLLSQFTGL
ncbi:AAA domain-containing protein [Paenibacillus sp. BSR1-1]|uniref:AAA domain-containing protein n=1 Tax=Paenibacillus sp. BSR1-1 TaxID=3020845 RepID=UPI0025B0364D|nr:AAA domain-containing protein [Paenibacillus sp. BSR1-1]MDN3016308.1 AAA domain-containing protein [Paenibacillus sp. BSR1-1]